MSNCGSAKTIPPFTGESIWDVPPISYDAATDTYTESNGCVYRQLPQELPFLAPFYSQFELHFHALPYVRFAERYMWVAFAICGAYLAFCFIGKLMMASRRSYDLKPALAAWNLLLSTFSLIGFLRTAPHLLYYLYSNGFYSSVCMPAEPAYGHGAAGLWTMLFIFSKIPELIDTVFIIFRKRTLIFLHWYHHVTVLLYCWHSYATRSSAGLYFVSMNYGVHALMYFYYYLTAMGIRVKWDKIVTTLQISQMFVGVSICAAVYYYAKEGLECEVSHENYVAGLVMYASYAVLFVWFALERYVFPAPASKTGAAASKGKVDAALQGMLSPTAEQASPMSVTGTGPANLAFYGQKPKAA